MLRCYRSLAGTMSEMDNFEASKAVLSVLAPVNHPFHCMPMLDLHHFSPPFHASEPFLYNSLQLHGQDSLVLPHTYAQAWDVQECADQSTLLYLCSLFVCGPYIRLSFLKRPGTMPRDMKV